MRIRTLLILFTALAMQFLGCQKPEQPEVIMLQDVVFSVSQVDPFLFKFLDDVECQLDASGNLKLPSVAEVIIDGNAYYPEVFFLNGKLYTQSIKLNLPGGAEATYNITKFALLEFVGGDMLMATPDKNSFYAAYVSKGVDFDIIVTPFGKTEVAIEVLCYMPLFFDLFGFSNNNLSINHYE